MAKQAVTYIRPGDVIYLTTSSVGYYMARNLPQQEMTVLTNSVTTADVLRKKENISVILLGGEMSHRGHCHDYYTIQMVKISGLTKRSFLIQHCRPTSGHLFTTARGRLSEKR